ASAVETGCAGGRHGRAPASEWVGVRRCGLGRAQGWRRCLPDQPAALRGGTAEGPGASRPCARGGGGGGGGGGVGQRGGDGPGACALHVGVEGGAVGGCAVAGRAPRGNGCVGGCTRRGIVVVYRTD